MAGRPPPKKSLGQHFLNDPGILRRIVELARVGPGDRVLEIGPGPGGLTEALLGAGAGVLAIEADGRMVEHLESRGLAGLHLLHRDALKTDYLSLALETGGRFKLVANLPYNISGPLLAKLLREREAFTDMTLMFQREVAERIAAGPGGKERGILGVLAQAFCQIEKGFRLPPGAFRPPPKVESMVIRLRVLDTPLIRLANEELLWKIVHEAFQKRRKQLRNCLRHRLTDPEAFFAALGLTGTERPEELPTLKWLELANLLALNPAGIETKDL